MIPRLMTDAANELPDDLASAHAMILAERAARRDAEAQAAPGAGGERALARR